MMNLVSLEVGLKGLVIWSEKVKWQVKVVFDFGVDFVKKGVKYCQIYLWFWELIVECLKLVFNYVVLDVVKKYVYFGIEMVLVLLLVVNFVFVNCLIDVSDKFI